MIMDLTNQQFGNLLVKECCGCNKWGHTQWLCECKCGNVVKRTTSVLRQKQSTSCGCQRRTYDQPVYEMIGKKFGRLEVKEFSERKNGKLYWKCLCECGKGKTVNGAHLRYGNTQSCGCLHIDSVSNSGPKPKRDPTARRVSGSNAAPDRGYYRVNSGPHERALAAAGISFA